MSENTLRRRTSLDVYKREQARISRRKLYKTTTFYSSYSFIVLYFALRSNHPIVAAFLYLIGMSSYTFVEYITHRWMFHYHFVDRPGYEHYLYLLFDKVHNGHHDNPLDGEHINGRLRDVLPLFIVCAPLSFIAPIYTLPIILAGNVQGYILTEWIHHSIHFYPSRNIYLRYARRHHFYHHSPKGVDRGFGVTNGFWDILFKTRYSHEVRWALHQRPKLKPAR
jgi:sterol desaturase/sphingolipid hydroxylase (fatty acid hydroxylase superfamily)